MPINRKKIFGWIKVIVILYCGIGISLYYLQWKILFHPKKLETNHVFQFTKPFKEISIPINETDTISMVKFYPADSLRRGVVVYYHGNMENIEHYAPFAKNFTEKGYEVWMQDYPGFGKSRGDRTEEKMYSQAMQVMKMAAATYGSDSIVIYGRSLGTGIAAYVASLSSCKKLILETPYYSIPDLFNSFSFIYPASYMSEYKIPTWKYLQDVQAPISIFHGDNDWIIPHRCAARLKQYLKPPDEFITIKKGGHNNLNDFPQYHHALDSLLK
ncbi:alpha/beta fold hydrolase [soil metagenome]